MISQTVVISKAFQLQSNSSNVEKDCLRLRSNKNYIKASLISINETLILTITKPIYQFPYFITPPKKKTSDKNHDLKSLITLFSLVLLNNTLLSVKALPFPLLFIYFTFV